MSDFYDTKILNYFGLPVTEGDVGIEIEIEANSPLPSRAPKGWVSHNDGSLHASYAVEYVTNGAIPIAAVEDAVAAVQRSLTNANTDVADSVRAGVHVHVNCQHLTARQTINFALTYLAMESALVRWCGSNRMGNLFCLRASDAEFLIDSLARDLDNKKFRYVLGDSVRYSSLNFNSLAKFGTLEFRALQTYPDLSKIVDWANILILIRDFAVELDPEYNIALDISLKTPELWLREVLGSYYNQIFYEGVEKDILRDVRTVQEIIFMKKK